MINTMTLRAGPQAGTSGLPITLTPITLFVGPNNSGKSRVLSELTQICGSGIPNVASLLLRDVTLKPFSIAEADSLLASLAVSVQQQEALPEGNRILVAAGNRYQVNEKQFLTSLCDPNSPNNRQYVSNWFLQRQTLKLDAVARMSLINEGLAGDLLTPGNTPLQILFRKDELRVKLRRRIFDAFGKYFAIDPTNPPNLRIKLSEVPVPVLNIERGWSQESVNYYLQSKDIQEFSDGVKAFIGIMMAVSAGDPQVILIDEPEAFLHPTLAFKLAKNIAETIGVSSRRLFVATHSPDFVMGCISSGAPINIVRLTYQSGHATARVLENEKLLKLMRNPLLRSTGTVGGLFYQYVVVTEADSDRAFYQEINERLVTHGGSRGVANALFLNAQNRQTVDQIIRPLRELGIPAAAIIDIDVVKEGGVVFSRLLDAAFVPAITRQSLATARSQLNNAFKATNQNPVTCGGIGLLSGEELASAKDFLDTLADYGIFVVDRGELETWLPSLGASFPKDEWLSKVFELMGEDPAIASYVKPSTDDVWAFIDRVAFWLSNDSRKGVP